MSHNQRAGTANNKSVWTRPGFIAASAVVAIIVVLGFIIALSGDSDSEREHSATPPPTGQPSTKVNGYESVCGLDAGDQALPDSAPEAKWVLRGTVAVPSAPSTFGPQSVAGGVPSCFAHSPTGALFAMVNVQAAMSAFAKKPGRYPIDKVLRMIAAGPGRDVLKDAAARAPVAKKGATTSGAEVAGFNIVRYEPGTAVIDLAFGGDRPETAGYVHGQSTMRWEDGDWKLVLAQNGAPFDAVQPIADLTGYVPWRGI
jgi:hypothetical protein